MTPFELFIMSYAISSAIENEDYEKVAQLLAHFTQTVEYYDPEMHFGFEYEARQTNNAAIMAIVDAHRPNTY